MSWGLAAGDERRSETFSEVTLLTKESRKTPSPPNLNRGQAADAGAGVS